MRKSYLIMTVGLVVLTIIIVASFYISLFYIGQPRFDAVYVDHVDVTKNQIRIAGGTSSSGDAYKDFKYEIDGESLYITINYVLASNSYRSGDFTINSAMGAILKEKGTWN